MVKTRAELKKLLAKLDQSMPALIRQYPEEHDFMPAFAVKADAITDAAGSKDYDWVNDEIDWILDKHGKLGDDYLPQHIGSQFAGESLRRPWGSVP